MKKLIPLFILIFSFSIGFSAITGTISNGDWSDVAIWDNGLPENADTIIIRDHINLDEDINLDNQLLIITTGAVLCGSYNIFVSYNSIIRVDGYLGANSIQVEGTFINNGNTHANVTVDPKSKDANIYENVPINHSPKDCPEIDTLNPPINPAVRPLLIKDDTITICTGEKLDLDLPYTKARYNWSDGSENSSFSPTEEGRYYVTITTLTDTLQDSVFVKIRKGEIIIPNIFTPNNDGINDHFLPLDFDLISLNIYNRWGRKVLETSNANNINFNNLNDGTYFYVMEHESKCLEKNPIKAWIEVSR